MNALTYAIEDIDGDVAGDEVRSPVPDSSRPPEVGLYIVRYNGSTVESGTHISCLVCQEILVLSERGRETRVLSSFVNKVHIQTGDSWVIQYKQGWVKEC